MGRMKTSWVRWASAEVWVQMGAYCADKRGNVALILMWCTLILSIHIYRFSLSVHFSFIFIFPLLHTIFISTSRFFLVLSQHICPLSLCPSLWLKFSLPDWKVSTLPKAEKGLEASSPFVAHHHLPNGQRWLNPDFLACSRYPHPVQCSLLSLQLGRTYLKCSASPVPCQGMREPSRPFRRPCEFGSPIWVRKHSTLLPNNLWALNNLFFTFSASFSATHLAPPEQRVTQWFGAWLLAGDLFPSGQGGVSRGQVVCRLLSGELRGSQT